MKIKALFASAVVIGGAVLAGCTDDIPQVDATERYAREFAKTFGMPEANNPYNVASRSEVTVVTPSSTRVRVTAVVNGTEYLFADYASVDGKQNLGFDIPLGITDIRVHANGRTIAAKIGDVVDLNAVDTETVTVTNDNPIRDSYETLYCRDNTIKLTHTGAKVFDSQDLMDFFEKFPEYRNNLKQEGVCHNYSFKAKAGDKMTLYPLYNSGKEVYTAIGIYWIDENSVDSETDRLKWYKMSVEETGEHPKYTIDATQVLDYTQDIYHTKHGGMSVMYFDESGHETEYKKVGENWDGTWDFGEDRENKGKIKTQGVTIEFEDDVTFGFFIKPYNLNYDQQEFDDKFNACVNLEHTTSDYYWLEHFPNIAVIPPFWAGPVFSHNKHNDKFGIIGTHGDWSYGNSEKYMYLTPHIDGEIYKGDDNNWYCNVDNCTDADEKNTKELYIWNFSFGPDRENSSIYTRMPRKGDNGNSLNERYYLAFDYFFDDSGDLDCNDLVFIMDYMQVKPVDENYEYIHPEDNNQYPAYEWIIAAEDLGSTCDWDFNDMVLGVRYIAGLETIEVRALAAGGTLPVYLMFEDPVTKKNRVVGKELHAWVTNGKGDYKTPVNVSDDGEEYLVEAVEMVEWTGSEPFSLAADTDTWESNMGGFWLLVDKDNKCADFTPEDFSNLEANDHGYQAVTPNMSEKVDKFVPLMICVGGEWCWPKESQHINEAFPSGDGSHGFVDWLKDSGIGRNWYAGGGKEGIVVKRESVTKGSK
ncbi:MAG: hypothetical protein J1E29_07275 [Duncaniella sp.]|nr:hypothetical protein [Duncaniella sp.]